MLDFSGKDQKAQQVFMHYAKKLNADSLIPIIKCNASVTSRDEAEKLSRFFWLMLEASADDRDKGKEVLGEADLQHWMGRSMNVISGYLSSIGYGEVWDQVSDEF
jgi:ABC-type molybdate transport system ATPase subunit